MHNIEEIEWDVVVIGGGPSGMMAAGTSASRGKKVLLIEKNDTLGKKLLITGGGRCNMTNAEEDTRAFLSKYKDSDKFLFSAFSKFSVKETLEFFHSKGLQTKVEALGRVFPITDKAESVWNILVDYLRKSNVHIASETYAAGFETENGEIKCLKLRNGKKIIGKSFILATGGKSRPETGSTGEGFEFLQEIGHAIHEPANSLVPIQVKDAWVKRLQGVSLDDVKITVLQNNEKQETKRGRILFTHFGLSGPTILNLSSGIGELLKYGDVELSLDIMPMLDHGQLNSKLQEIFKDNTNKKLKNSLDSLVPGALSPILLELSGISGETPSHSITRENRLKLIGTLKNLRVKAETLLGEDKAIVTSGGVALDEVDFKTMSSKIFPNLFLVGDVLDIDRPSGGYSLQLCWTTGFVAGTSA